MACLHFGCCKVRLLRYLLISWPAACILAPLLRFGVKTEFSSGLFKISRGRFDAGLLLMWLAAGLFSICRPCVSGSKKISAAKRSGNRRRKQTQQRLLKTADVETLMGPR